MIKWIPCKEVDGLTAHTRSVTAYVVLGENVCILQVRESRIGGKMLVTRDMDSMAQALKVAEEYLSSVDD
jgi:hypothetical protein